MNIFILNTGRCGSTTFIKACEHISNFTAGHETRANCIGEDRLDYPNNHIEADNRLSWVLGRLDKKYGNDALYIHLSRELNKTIESFARRNEYGIMKAYREGILLDGQQSQTPQDLARDYIDTVETNIAFFLKDKTNKMQFNLENAKQGFQIFWELIGAEGNLENALMEWDVSYNASA